MTEAEVIKVKDELKRVIDSHGLWSKVTEDRRPDLKMMTIEVQIKVDGGKK